MALNFGLLGDAGAPAMGYIQGQQDVARNQLAQQQVETGRMTQDKMRMEMDSMRRRQAGLDQFMQKAKELGVDGDPEQLTQVFYEHAISTGDMQQVQAAQIARQAAKERKDYMASQPGAGTGVDQIFLLLLCPHKLMLWHLPLLRRRKVMLLRETGYPKLKIG